MFDYSVLYELFYSPNVTCLELCVNLISNTFVFLILLTSFLVFIRSLYNNNISNLEEDVFSELHQLRHLDLSGNLISIGMREFEKVFLPLRSLKSLYVFLLFLSYYFGWWPTKFPNFLYFSWKYLKENLYWQQLNTTVQNK